MIKRAYMVLNVRETGERAGKRTFKGIATTPTTDSYGDVIESDGAMFDLPMPFLWMHDSSDPVGWITSAKTTKKQIEVEGEVADIPEEGPLKERLATAWQYLKNKLVRGLSIGFNPIESARIDGTYGIHFTKWHWLELSAVTIPANMDASITAIKSADAELRALSGLEQRRRPPDLRKSPVGEQRPASGGFSFSRSKGNEVKTLQEMVEARTTKAARMTELMELRKSESRRFSPEEAGEFEVLTDEVGELDDEILVKRFEERQAASATRVKSGSADDQRASRGPTILVKKEDPKDAFAGQSFIRCTIAKAVARLTGDSAAAVAQYRWGQTHPKLVQFIKAGVAGGGTGSGEWGAELAQSDTRFTGDFIEFLYSMTVFDRLPLRSIPARVHVKGQDGAATGYWVGESKAIPVSKADFSDVELTPLKVAALAVISNELITDSSPSAELWVRDSIAQASAQRVDTTFLGTGAASAGVSPAGLGNGLTPLAPSGADAAAVRNDTMALYADFLAAKNASGLVHVMTPSMAKAISLMVNSLGFKEFPELRATGGTLEGDPVFTGDNVAGGDWYLLKPSDIWKIGDSGVQVSMSDVATIEQDDSPAGASDTPTAASATLMSMFQTESTAFKVVRRINYAKRRTGAAKLLQNGEYGGIVS